MGNQSSSTTRRRPSRAQSRYGAIAQDHVLVNSNIIEYPSALRRNLALLSILVCQTFFWTAFSVISMWIPQTLKLNVFFFDLDGDQKSYFRYIVTMSVVPTLALILLYSAAWISGILMDSCVRKTWCLFTFVIFAGVAFSFVVAIILTLAQHVFCHFDAGNITFTCSINSSFFLCGDNVKNNYCKDEYIAWLTAIAAIGAVIRTALPALGGDQIPARHGVRVFYAQFYGCQKLGQALAAALCLVYLSAWQSFRSKHPHDKTHYSLRSDYQFLFYGWGGAIIAATILMLAAMMVVVCCNLLREVRPDFGVVQKTAGILRQAYTRHSDMEDDPSVGCLDGAKMSLGGSYPDLAVTERTELAKFGLVLIILIPVAFGTTLPMLPDIPEFSSANKTMKEVTELAEKDVSSLAISSLASYVMSGVAIIVIHKICTKLAENGRALTLLHRLVAGHIAMIMSIVSAMIIQKYNSKYNVATSIGPMLLVGLSNAFIYTAGYELTLISAPRSMQGTAMGMFYLMDGVANIANILVINYTNYNNSKVGSPDYYLVMGVGGVASMLIACVLLVLAERKYSLGTNRL